MWGRKEKFLAENTKRLKHLDQIEKNIGLMEKDEIITQMACSATCKICQCVECAKIPGGDV